MMRKGIVVLLVVCVGIFFLPEFGSSGLGKKFFNRVFSGKFHANTSIQEIHLSWRGPQIFHHIALTGPHMIGHIEEFRSDVPFWKLGKAGTDFQIKEGHFTFPSQGNAALTQVKAEIHGHNLVAQGKAVPAGQFTLTGKIFSEKDFDVTFDLKEIPTALLDQLSEKTVCSQVLGSTFDATGAIVLNHSTGHLSCDLSSPNLHTSLRSQIDQADLLLTHPLRLFFHPPEIESKESILLEIDPESCQIPWRSFSLDKVHIPHATLDIGHIGVKTDQNLSLLFSLFQNFRKSSTTEIWAAPVSLSLEKGILRLGRLDALIGGTMHICLWGKIEGTQLDLTLGLCADTLAHSFGIQGLSRNYVLKIPLRGTLQNPELDTTTAAAKIGALLALEGLPQIPHLGKLGKILKAAPKPQEDQSDVPAAKRPFPWER